MHTLASLASRELATLQGEALLADAITLMSDKNISSVLVARGLAVVGIITERDLVRLVATGVDPMKTTVEAVMTGQLVHLPETVPIDEALYVMEKEKVRHLVVTGVDPACAVDEPGVELYRKHQLRADDKGILSAKGIITYTDVVRKLEEEFFKKPLTVSDCMSTSLHRIDVNSAIRAAFVIMNDQRLSSLLVDRQGKTVGILTERDVVRFVRSGESLDNRVAEVMSPSPMTVSQDVSLFEAARIMEQHRIRRLLVRDPEGHICGMVSHSDIVRAVRKNYRAVLQGEAARSRKALSQIGEGVADLDGNSFRVLWINSLGADMLGLNSCAEALGWEFTGFLDAKGAEQLHRDFIQRTPRDAVYCTAALPKPGERHLWLSYEMIRDFRGGSCIRVVFRDITALASAQEKLEAEKTRLQISFHASREGILILTEKGRLIEWNRRARELLRLPDRADLTLTVGEWRQEVRILDETGRLIGSSEDQFQAFLETGQAVYDQLLRFLFHDGSSLWLMVSASPVLTSRCIIVTLYDVTARRQKELEIQRSEKKYRTLIHNLTEAVLLLTPAGDVLDLNPAAREILQITEDQPLPHPLAEFYCTFVDRDGRPIPTEEIARWEGTRRKAPFKDREIGIITGDRIYWGVLTQTPTFGQDGAVESMIVTFNDLTEYMESKRQEELLLTCSIDFARATTEDEVYTILAHYLRRLGRANGKLDAILLRAVTNPTQGQALIQWADSRFHFSGDFQPARCKAFASGVDLIVKDARIEYGCPAHEINADSGSYFCTNLSVAGQVVGVLHLYSSSAGFFDDQTARVVRSLLALAAPTISNMRLIDHNRRLSLIDPLTGLHNRRYLEQTMESMVAQAHDTDRRFSLLMADIDQFKKFNDTFGHDAGDKALRMVAANVRNCLREEDIAVRFGGEEITIILMGATKDMGVGIADRIRKRIEQTPIEIGDDHIQYVTLSIGVSAFPEDGKTLEKLIQRADVALYEAKRRGKNCVAAFERAQ
ncbi:diguanylate cyclase [Heliobacterium gestii]|uniref:Diguanylate cyclase n=1 Tax=Heliomicrobium gestii TaxID=2699 RepID=A0A845LD30_HELGE|nr:diguanylate cyclase [Heliomicrobium gestii]MBM7868439.1 diguanylate cyclase (GGDEF)-like protein [Heliomicrobium gestii]MZP44572.1 diguanylate cyclase [Heliomicrobium gestii]